MTTDSEEMLLDQVLSLRDTLESDDIHDHLDNALEIRYEVGHNGTVHDVVITVTVGGPHIDVHCLSPAVVGYWAGDRVRRNVRSDELEMYGDELASRFEDRIDQ